MVLLWEEKQTTKGSKKFCDNYVDGQLKFTQKVSFLLYLVYNTIQYK